MPQKKQDKTIIISGGFSSSSMFAIIWLILTSSKFLAHASNLFANPIKPSTALFSKPKSKVSSLIHLYKQSFHFDVNLNEANLNNAIALPRGGDEENKSTASTPISRPYLPHTLSIRDSIMIAHSFYNHPSFGPAGGLHGATYTVDVEFASPSLHPECNWVIDIGVASELVGEVLKKYNYKNLDEEFGEGVMTTTEFMCEVVWRGVVGKLKERYGGSDDAFEGWIKVTLWESHMAWGSYEGPFS